MCMQVPTYLPSVLSLRPVSSVFDRFLSTSALASVDAILLPTPTPSAGRTPHAKGLDKLPPQFRSPTHAPERSRFVARRDPLARLRRGDECASDDDRSPRHRRYGAALPGDRRRRPGRAATIRLDRGRHAAETRSGMVNACSGRGLLTTPMTRSLDETALPSEKSRSRRVKGSVGIVSSVHSPPGPRPLSCLRSSRCPSWTECRSTSRTSDHRHVYFPISGVISTGERDARGHGEVGNDRPRGDDGTAARAARDDDADTRVRSGAGSRVSHRGADLRAVMREAPQLERLLYRYVLAAVRPDGAERGVQPIPHAGGAVRALAAR